MRIEHLHLHTEYSTGDGMGSLTEVAEAVLRAGGRCVCVTDHGHLYSLPDAYDLTEVTYVPGCELYVIDPLEKARHGTSHLTVLAADDTGLVNMLDILSRASTEYYYYKPRVPVEELLGKDGILVLSGCISGYCAKPFLDGNPDESRKRLDMLAQNFRGRFFAEVQPHPAPDQAKWNRFLVGWARSRRVPIVLTNDVHFPSKSDFVWWRVVKGGRSGAPPYGSWRTDVISGLWAKNADLFGKYAALVRNACSVADMCNVNLPHAGFRVPSLGGIERLRSLVGIPATRAERERVEYELSVIGRTGFADFFLLVYEIVRWARSKGFYVSNRGSAVASLVLYKLGVTTLHPIEYGLVFERFLNPERTSPPDIDLDVERKHRDAILEYIFGRWSGNVAHLSNIVRYHEKLLWHDVRRAEKSGYLTAKEAAACASQIEGSPLIGRARNISVHAGGLVFFPDDFRKYTHLYRTNSQIVAAVDKYGAEKMGLMKLDILVVDTLDVIRLSMPKGVDPFKIKPDDDKVYAYLRSKPHDYVGLFQISRDVGVEALRTIQPIDFEELMAVISTIRPGSMSPSEYVGWSEDIPDPFKPILANTRGAMVYQEQRMQLMRLVGFTYGEIDDVLKLIKRKEEIPLSYMHKWLRGCAKLGIPANVAKRYWSYIPGYGFNRAHAAGYAYLTYLTALLKRYRYKHFMLALLKMERNEERVREIVRECIRNGVEFLPPSVNSTADYSLENGKIRVGYAHIKGVGYKAASLIEQNAPYTRQKWKEFVESNKRVLNARVLKALEEAGALKEVV
jgi:DNA polymerase-3 subunit alpha